MLGTYLNTGPAQVVFDVVGCNQSCTLVMSIQRGIKRRITPCKISIYNLSFQNFNPPRTTWRELQQAFMPAMSKHASWKLELRLDMKNSLRLESFVFVVNNLWNTTSFGWHNHHHRTQYNDKTLNNLVICYRSPHIHCITQLRWIHTRMNAGVIKLWYTPLKSCRAITSCKSLTQAIITVLRPLNRKEHRRQLSKMERVACYFVSPVVRNQLWKSKEGKRSTTETVNIIIKVQITKTQLPYQPTKDTRACNSIKKMTGMVQLIMFIVAPNWEE